MCISRLITHKLVESLKGTKIELSEIEFFCPRLHEILKINITSLIPTRVSEKVRGKVQNLVCFNVLENTECTNTAQDAKKKEQQIEVFIIFCHCNIFGKQLSQKVGEKLFDTIGADNLSEAATNKWL